MKFFADGTDRQKGFPKQMSEIMTKYPGMADFFKNWSSNITELMTYFNGLQGVDPALKSRVADRINAFHGVANCVNNLMKSDLPPRAFAENLSNMVIHFNAAMGKPADAEAETSLADDIATLMNQSETDLSEEPHFVNAMNIAQICTGIEAAQNQNIMLDEFDKIGRAYDEIEEKRKKLEEDFDRVVGEMNEVEPNCSIEGLNGKINSGEIELNAQKAKLNKLQSPAFVAKLNERKRDIDTEVQNREKELKEYANEVARLKDKADFIEKGGEYSLNRLLKDGGIQEFQDIEDGLRDDRNWRARLDEELKTAENRSSILKEAENKVKAAEDNMRNLLKNDHEHTYELLNKVISVGNNSKRATELIDELSELDQNDFFPALLDNGMAQVHKNIGKQTKDPGKFVTRDFLHKRAIAEKYAEMRQCIIDASKDPKATAQYFDDIEKAANGKVIDMKAIKEKFAEEMAAATDDAINFQTQLMSPNKAFHEGQKRDELKRWLNATNLTKAEFDSYMPLLEKQEFFDFTNIEGFQDALQKVAEANDELNDTKKRLEMTRSVKEVKASIQKCDLSMKNYQEQHVELQNKYLTQFGAEPTDKKLSIAEIANIGTSKFAQAKQEVLEYESGETQVAIKREVMRLKKLKDSASPQKHFDKIKEVSNGVKNKEAEVNKLKNLGRDFRGLIERNNELASDQFIMKSKCTEALSKESFTATAAGLQTCKDHILDAQRFVKHKNTQDFESMYWRLEDTVRGLKRNDLSTQQKVSKLKSLKEYADKYLDAKKSQFFVLGTKMRKSRIEFATNISRMAEEEIKRQELLKNGPEKQKVVNAQNSKHISSMTEQEFSAKFRNAQAEQIKKQNEMKAKLESEQNAKNMGKKVNKPAKGAIGKGGF